MKLYRIFLPKTYNDGTPIEDSKLREITKQIRDKFKGYSANPKAVFPIWEGAWIDEKHNRALLENVICVELFTQDTFDNQRWMRSQTELWKQTLEQDDLFVLVQNAEMIKKVE